MEMILAHSAQYTIKIGGLKMSGDNTEKRARLDELDETLFQSRDPNIACFPNEHAVEVVEW